MLENLITDKLDYKKLSPEEQQKRGILGRLVGVIADSKNATRNGRKYSEKLWENVFKDPIMQERIQTNCCFGELGHPADREETDMEKIAICMDGLPKKDSNGRLQAVFNILDTPNGRILKTLCDYGCKIGVSSRGSGEVTSNFDGTEDVDPDSYECQGFDAVIIPAVKEARLNYVTEELDKTRYNKTLRARLQESYEKASASDKKVMKETFENIGVEFEKSYPVEFTYTYESDDTPYTNYFGHLNVVADSEQEALEKAEAYVNSPEYQNYNLHQHSFRQFRIADTKYNNVDLVEAEKDSHPEDEYTELNINETLKQNDSLKEYTTYWFGEKEYPLNFDNGMYDPHTGQFEDGTTLDDYDKEDMAWFDIDESLNEDNKALQKEQYDLYPGAEFTSKTGHKIWIDSVQSSFSPYDGSPYISVGYRYKMVDGKEGESSCNTLDLFNMLKEGFKPSNKVNNIAVDNNEAMVEQLQTLLTRNADLESKVIELQEKLSVCYAKENLTEDKIASYKTAIKSLTQDNTKAKALVEKLNTTKEKLDDSNKRITTLESLLKTSLSSKRDLKERLTEKTKEVFQLKEQLDAANRSKEKLNEDFNGSEKERDLLKKQYQEKLDNSKQLIEKYKTVAKTAVNKYINSQAVRIGVKPEEIKNKLPESYGFKDIDSICEDLKKYKVSVGRLPFNTTMLRENKVQMSATPSKNDPLTMLGNIDDDVDSQLLSLAKIN